MYEKERVRFLRRPDAVVHPIQRLYVPRKPEAKVLVAISSCQGFEDKGWNDSLRNTWLPDLAAHRWDYKFFHGRGAAAFKDDIVVVDSDDAYFDLTTKTKEKTKWAVRQGYEYVFMCFPDTFPCIERLVVCDFRKYEYYGTVFQHQGGTPYCQGGCGYFLSRRAAQIVAFSSQNYPNEDCFVGDLMHSAHIAPGHNDQFCYSGPGPLKTNQVVTNHLSTQPKGFSGPVVEEEYKRWKNSLSA